jgi:hypothetical protein
LFLGFWVDYVMSKTHIESVTNQRAKHPFEYGPLHRHHSFPSQILRENQVGVGQGQYFPRLPLQDLFHEYPCHPLMHLYPLLPLVPGFYAEEGVVGGKDGFGPMDNGADGFVRAEFQEQIELVDGIWEFFGTSDSSSTIRAWVSAGAGTDASHWLERP